MKTLTLKNISKEYPNKLLFKDVSFSVSKRDRIAVTGFNGAGKSTLLKIITNQESATSGRIINDRVHLAYIGQEFSGDTTLSMLEYIDTTKATSKVFDLLKKFAVISDELLENASVDTLSGGQRRILEICCVMSAAPMVLCIDEPENHLDIKARSVLTNLLCEYWGAVMFVSHDRHLINEVANKIINIKNHECVMATAKSYEDFQTQEQLKRGRALARWKAEDRAVTKLEDSVRMLKKRTRYNDAQAKTYQMKKRELQLRQEALGAKPELEARTPQVELCDVRKKTGKLIFCFEHVDLHYTDDTPILKDVDVSMRFGEKVVLLGRNGAGKTSLVNLIIQKLLPSGGVVRIGADIKIEYIDQLYTLDTELSPLEHFYSRGYEEESARRLVAQYFFTQAEATTALKILSRGQQQRFLFLFLFQMSPEFIILDEPTNNIDPDVWELLLRLVNEFSGSLLLVSHDRSFIERIEQKRIWILKNKTITESWNDLDSVLKEL